MKRSCILCALTLVLLLGGCARNQAQTDTGAEEAAQPAPDAPGLTVSGAEMISAEEAQAEALSHAGLTSDQVTFVKNKLEYEGDRQVYDVEFFTASYAEYDYEIDAYTGEIVSVDYDAEGYAASSVGGTITAEEARELALSQVPGATANDIRLFETDYDDGQTEYEGKIVYNGMEYEFTIDGSSGAIRKWEAEPAGR